MIDYNIVNTGSDGNAVIINKFILIDCGVPFKALKPYYKDLKIVLMTHIHSDHFNRVTIKKLAKERPTVRWVCASYLVEALVACGVPKTVIDVIEYDKIYSYGLFYLIPVPLTHNVPNTGYKLMFGKEKVFYATDFNNFNGISAKNYDLYLVEANYVTEEIEERIRQKRADGLYAYELQAVKNHMSKEKCDAWLYANMKSTSTYVYLHSHKNRPEEAV